MLSAGALSPELGYSLHTYVAMGGTFDRLHSGHRMLLTSSLLHTRDKLRIGITGQKLLANKKHAHMMQSFSERVEGAMQFVNKIRSDVEFETPELVEPSGGTDKIGEVTAMVVSPETLPSLDAINKVRADNGLEPMLPVMIEYVGGDASQRVSSTQLRKQAALAATSAASRAADTTSGAQPALAAAVSTVSSADGGPGSTFTVPLLPGSLGVKFRERVKPPTVHAIDSGSAMAGLLQAEDIVQSLSIDGGARTSTIEMDGAGLVANLAKTSASTARSLTVNRRRDPGSTAAAAPVL